MLIGLFYWPVTLENYKKMKKGGRKTSHQENSFQILHSYGQNHSRIIFSFMYPGSFFLLEIICAKKNIVGPGCQPVSQGILENLLSSCQRQDVYLPHPGGPSKPGPELNGQVIPGWTTRAATEDSPMMTAPGSAFQAQMRAIWEKHNRVSSF